MQKASLIRLTANKKAQLIGWAFLQNYYQKPLVFLYDSNFSINIFITVVRSFNYRQQVGSIGRL